MMRIAILAPVGWSRSSMLGKFEGDFISLLSRGLVSRGVDITLFAAIGDSENDERIVKLSPEKYMEQSENWQNMELSHLSDVFENGEQFDLIHNSIGYLPLTYKGLTNTPVLTVVHGGLSSKILPVYEKYNKQSFYVSVCDGDKYPSLYYSATIYNGVDLSRFKFSSVPGEYLLCLEAIHPERGIGECIEIAGEAGMKLILGGIIEDKAYFETCVRPYLSESLIYTSDKDGYWDLLKGAYALINPLYSGVFSEILAVEAMACGTPVISLDGGCMPEFVIDGATGFLVPDYGQMVEAVEKIGQISRLRCRCWVEERFASERMIEDYLNLYRRIIEQTRREEHRPWGFYEIISDNSTHKVKRITVYPGQRLSYQRHLRRSEHWYMLTGNAVVTKNDEDFEIIAGESIDLPVYTWHRIQNRGLKNLVFIEVQTGDYFGEDDIERLEDDYGRVLQTALKIPF